MLPAASTSRARPARFLLGERENERTRVALVPKGDGQFFAMPELKEAMSQGGVNADSVEISYFDEVETGTLAGV